MTEYRRGWITKRYSGAYIALFLTALSVVFIAWDGAVDNEISAPLLVLSLFLAAGTGLEFARAYDRD